MQNIKELSLDEIKDFLQQKNEKGFRAKQIYGWLWQKNVKDFDQMSNLSKSLRELLKSEFEIKPIKITYSVKSDKDNSSKYAFMTHDNLLIEGVLIPDKKRVTACISTQVGCPLTCKFCATGTMGLKRNLTKAEIYEQVFLLNQEATKAYGHELTNIVIMGMGEPLLNLNNTLNAIELITGSDGLAMSPQRITLSTSGLVKQLKRLADTEPKFNLAISLHSATNNNRSSIMPVNIRNPLPALVEALKYYHKKTQKRITIEYLLIGGLTDRLEDAKALADFCRNFPTKINLIEFNPVEHIDYKKSKPKDITKFHEFLLSKNLVVTIRRSKGQDISAACGQLAVEKEKNA